MFLNLNFLGIKLSLKNVSPIVAIPAFILFWSIGVLFNYHIAYTFETVFAALALALLLITKAGD